jgi:glucose-6-phosphate isomerase
MHECQNHYYRTHVSRTSIMTGPLTGEFHDASLRLEQMACADALWSRRLSIWPGDSATQASVANRLGWLDALDFIEPQLQRLRTFADSIRNEGLTDVVLLGMGGSSLAPEVLRQVLGVSPGRPRFRMLDSVDPDAVRAAMENAATSLFIFASKSGSTIEPSAMAAEARRRVTAAGHEWGTRVVAITDDNSALHARARAERYRDVFINPGDIGGRYSALSFFGLVPAALMGVDLERLVATAREMESACRRTDVRDNPGLTLGAMMAAGERAGRDKLTLLLSPRLQSLGLWIEQLVAESTGKNGRGVVPIAGEPAASATGSDRIAVTLRIADDVPAPPLPADVPALALEMPEPIAIGAEFFRWEFATAVAGALMGVNPFDEPNVTQAKTATRRILDIYAAQKRVPTPEPHAVTSGARLSMTHAAEEQLSGVPAESFLRLVRPPDYFSLLVYLPPEEPAFAAALHDFRLAVGSATGCATMFGYGPRYLHSTGQLHKGGGNNGVFIIVSADDVEDLSIPGELFSFGVLELAQALGDFQSLDSAGRRALHVHLPKRDPELLREIAQHLLEKR